MTSLQKWLLAKVLSGYVIGGAVAAVILRVAYSMDTGSWRNTLIVLLGGVFGWSAGILFTPKTKADDTKFSLFRASAATFFGGFVVAKLDRLFEANIQSSGVVSEEFVIGALLFSIAFGLGLLFTFVGRLADDVFKK